jgi:tetratricopeptide (TPR) repeat protein
MDRARLAALVEASRKAQLDLSIYEWRDIIYLARHLGTTSGDRDVSRPDERSDRPGPPAPTGSPEPRAPDEPPGAEPLRSVDQSEPRLQMFPYPSWAASGEPHLPIRAPAAPALPGGAFARAFRPVKRTVDATVEVEVDVPETVRRAAESEFWHPAVVPATDRWLSLAVVVDDAGSGPAWGQEVRNLLRALQESGAFGDIRVWRFDSDTAADGPLTIRGDTTAAPTGRDSREIVDPTGRWAVLVLSDCVGMGWGDGRVGKMIATWVAANPVAVLHLLPQRLWGRCRPQFTTVAWRAARQFGAGQRREWRRRDAGHLTDGPPAPGAGIAAMVPVLDFTPSALAGWASLVAGAAPDWVPGVAFDTGAREAPDTDDAGAEEPTDDDPYRRRVDRFRAVASPEAFRLATLLSTAPLQLPIVRMIQRSVLHTDRSTYWAEILLSGLVCRLPDPVGREAAHEVRRELAFDFAKGIREQLLTGLTRRESLDLLHQVSDFVSTRLGGSLDFLALMTLDTAPERLSEADRPFAEVAIQVLRSLGGVYADKAAAIKHLLPDGSAGSHIRTTTDDAAGGIPPRDGDLVVTASNTTQTMPPGGRTGEIVRSDIWDVPQRTQNFTGRQVLLDGLRQELVDNKNRAAVLVPRALFGLGGVGKTALANEYAHRYRGEYEVVWWIPAEDPADVRRSLVELSRALRLPENTDQAETIRALLRALQDGYPKARWLLIYDNATRPESVADLLPEPRPHGHVLITSRDQTWGDRGKLLEVDVFTRLESVTLLRRRAEHLTAEDADQLAELLEDLPLALHQAAAWHAETELQVGEYRRRYDEKLALLPEVELSPDYPRPVGATFGVSYDQLQARSMAAAQLLQLCSYFGPEPIFVEMLYNARNVPGLPRPLNRQMADRSTIGRELREMGRYELIKFDQARGRFQLHRLVQSVLRRTLSDAERQATPLHAHSILALANPGNPDELSTAELVRHGQLSPHIQPSGIVASTDLEARRVVLDQIRYRYVVGDFEGSRDLAERTVEAWQQQWGDRDQLVLLARRHLATTLRSLGAPAEALRIDEKVLTLFRETVGEDSDHYLVTANGYAADLRALGRFKEALEFDRNLLAQHRRVLRDDDPATLRTANNYAVDLRLMGEFGQARDLDIETVRQWTEGYGSDFPETLFALSNLVRDYYGLGEYGKALNMQLEAITVHEAAVGSSHPSVLMARRTIAMLLRKLGRYREARERAEANHAAYAARFPEHHEHTLAATMSLANSLRDENNRDPATLRRARQLMHGALRIYERDFADHPFVQVCMTNLAVVLRRLGEVAQARELNAAARERLVTNLSADHPYALCSTTNLASDLAATGDYEQAARYSKEVLELSQAPHIRGPDHPYTLGCALNHALDLERIGREREGNALRRDTIERFDRVLGADHPDSVTARNRQRIDADIEPPPT